LRQLIRESQITAVNKKKQATCSIIVAGGIRKKMKKAEGDGSIVLLGNESAKA
jgi:hypothetical protein